MTLPFTQIIEDITAEGPRDWAWIAAEDGRLHACEDFDLVPGRTLFYAETALAPLSGDIADGWRGVRASTVKTIAEHCPEGHWLPSTDFWVELIEAHLPGELSNAQWMAVQRFLADHRYAQAIDILHEMDISAWLRGLEQVHTDLLHFATTPGNL